MQHKKQNCNESLPEYISKILTFFLTKIQSHIQNLPYESLNKLTNPDEILIRNVPDFV